MYHSWRCQTRSQYRYNQEDAPCTDSQTHVCERGTNQYPIIKKLDKRLGKFLAIEIDARRLILPFYSGPFSFLQLSWRSHLYSYRLFWRRILARPARGGSDPTWISYQIGFRASNHQLTDVLRSDWHAIWWSVTISDPDRKWRRDQARNGTLLSL